MKIRPLFNRLVVRKDEKESASLGGILIPDGSKQESLIGTVVAVGPGESRDDGSFEPMQVKVGDRVVFQKYCGVEPDFAEKGIMLIKESGILAVIEEE